MYRSHRSLLDELFTNTITPDNVLDSGLSKHVMRRGYEVVYLGMKFHAPDNNLSARGSFILMLEASH
jgi:hypothetical protein